MSDKLTIKQEKFAQGLFAGLSQREAYKQAFNCDKMTDKTIDEAACRLADNSKVTARIKFSSILKRYGIEWNEYDQEVPDILAEDLEE
jgi:phage terminase small subunit